MTSTRLDPVAKKTGFGRFFLPGPTDVHPDVANAQTRPMIGHRGKAIEDLIGSIQPGLRSIFRTARPVYISTSSATGLMEGAVRNGARKRVLSLVNGAFSDRFFRIALACGFDADELKVAPGEAHTPEMLANALRGRDYDAVTVVHSETATGVLNPVKELGEVVRDAGDITYLVDTVSSMAGAPFETDAWPVDFVFTGSQKAFAIPPGLAFGVANERILQRAKAKKDRGIYFDFVEYDKYIAKNQTPSTPAVSLLYALAAQIERINAETIEARWARHAEMAERTWLWVEEMMDAGTGVSFFAREGFRSPTVTCVRLPDRITGPEVASAMKARGYTIGSGYGELRDVAIRIGHMGDHSLDTLEPMLAELTQVLKR